MVTRLILNLRIPESELRECFRTKVWWEMSKNFAPLRHFLMMM